MRRVEVSMVKKVFCVVAAVSLMRLSVGCQTKQTVETEEKSVTDWGERVKENQSIPDDEAVAYVDGEPISKERF